jgi:hypothetical protein
MRIMRILLQDTKILQQEINLLNYKISNHIEDKVNCYKSSSFSQSCSKGTFIIFKDIESNQISGELGLRLKESP